MVLTQRAAHEQMSINGAETFQMAPEADREDPEVPYSLSLRATASSV